MVAAQQDPALAQRLHDLWRVDAADQPQARSRAGADARRRISDIFSAMQTTMGGTYINDFNLFGRTWQVKVQAEATDRKPTSNDMFRVRVRTSNGELVPLQAVANVELVTAPSSIVRYNNLRVGGAERRAGAGLLLGRGDRRHGDGRRRPCRAGYGYEWTGTALQEKAASRPDRLHPRPGRALRLPVPRRALREHGRSRSPALLSVVVGLFGAMAALAHRGSTTTSSPRSASSC